MWLSKPGTATILHAVDHYWLHAATRRPDAPSPFVSFPQKNRPSGLAEHRPGCPLLRRSITVPPVNRLCHGRSVYCHSTIIVLPVADAPVLKEGTARLCAILPGMSARRLTRIVSAMPLGMGAGLFRTQDLRTLAPSVESRSDTEAMRADWVKIGGDFRVAAQKLEADLARARAR